MNIKKRIKHIVSLTVDDFYSSGKSTSETPQDLKAWLVDDILKIEGVDDLYTYQISILILDKLKAFDIVDLGFIHDISFKNDFDNFDLDFEELDFKLDEVVL